MAASPLVPFVDPESPVFRAHEGGKLGVHATKPLRDRDDLSLLYTPGVAEVSWPSPPTPPCRAGTPHAATPWRSSPTAPRCSGWATSARSGAMPVMEGKAVLFKHFAGIDAVPIVWRAGSVDELVDAIARIAPSFGGINLEDISAPRCFDIEEQLKERLDIPVFHDDQHGTAIVVLAGLINAVRVLDRSPARAAGRRLRAGCGRCRRDQAASAGRRARRRRL
jgi:malate dehydrogenase (oxaloacetate-decarboxylating)